MREFNFKLMPHVFIGGVPAAGKTTLAKKLAYETGAKLYSIDSWRDEVRDHPHYGKAVKFFSDQDEDLYWQQHKPVDYWNHLVWQAETLWPHFEQKIANYSPNDHIIFEGVYILPHLAKSSKLQGVYLVCEDEQILYDRIRRVNRWGNLEHQLRTEAKYFSERSKILRIEAEKYGYNFFYDKTKAKHELLKILGVG
jgi:2-phosphoglycerate kinase